MPYGLHHLTMQPVFLECGKKNTHHSKTNQFIDCRNCSTEWHVLCRYCLPLGLSQALI